MGSRVSYVCWIAVLAVQITTACRRDPGPQRERAIAASQQFVKRQLATPGQIVYGGDADTTVEQLSRGRFRVRGMIDYQANDGAPIRTNFTCVVLYHGRDRWELEEMKFE